MSSISAACSVRKTSTLSSQRTTHIAGTESSHLLRCGGRGEASEELHHGACAGCEAGRRTTAGDFQCGRRGRGGAGLKQSGRCRAGESVFENDGGRSAKHRVRAGNGLPGDCRQRLIRFGAHHSNQGVSKRGENEDRKRLRNRRWPHKSGKGK